MGLLGILLGAGIIVQVSMPLIASRFIDQALAGAALDELVSLALLTIGLAIAGQGLAVGETYVAEYVSWSATNRLRADLLAHLLRLDASFHAVHTPGELIERVDGDVATLSRFFSRFVIAILGNGILITGVLGLLASLDWRVSLALGSFVVLALFIMLRIRASSTPFWAAERQATADFYGFIGEYLSGLEDVRSSGATAFVLRRCAEIMRSWRAITLRAQMRGYALVASSQGLFALGTVMALGVSIFLFREGTLTIGMVFLIFQYTEMLRQPTEQIRNEVQEFQQADASIERIEGLLQTQPRITDGPGNTLPAGPLGIEFDHVAFGYSPHTLVVQGITIRVEPGRILGIVGRTGSGKTTLTRLLARFHDPAEGSIRLGGIDIRSVRLEAIRTRIGLVMQDVQLFNASVRDNLTLFDDTVPDEQIERVLATLDLTDWLNELPHGLHTLLGSGGTGLSAGQEQLLACVRIFLRNPDLVILDEASSRLDPATEHFMHAALGRLLAGRTGIIVAHRLSTLAYADDIVVLEHGHIREYGSRYNLAADPTSHFAGLLRLAEQGHTDILEVTT